MKKRRVLAFGLIVIMMFFTGCSNTGKEESAKKEKEEIVVWSYYETKQQKEGMDYLVNSFNQAQSQYVAKWEYKGPAAEFKKQLSMGVAENILPDIVIIDNPDVERYAGLGIFEDMTEYMQEKEEKEEFYKATIEGVTVDDKVFGVPFCCNNVALIYRKDILGKTSIETPQNWKDFEIVVKELSNETSYGFGMSAMEGEQAAFQILPWILTNTNERQEISEDAQEKAYNLIKDLVNEKSIPKECINWSQVDLARQFVAGKCIMMENGPWVLPILEEASLDYDIAPLPIEKNRYCVAGGEDFGVIHGKNVEGAKCFMDFYYQDQIMLETNHIMCSLAPVRRLANIQTQQDKRFQVFVSQMEHAICRSQYDDWREMSNKLSEQLYQALIGTGK